MTVQITDPPDNGSFPNDEGWTATVTITSADAVDGTLLDLNTNEAYPSNNTTGSGPDGDGLYTWQVPFTPDADIANGDPLLIYCYDAEISGDADSHSDTASEMGLAGAACAAPPKAATPGVGTSSVDFTAAILSATSISVTVKLTPQEKGGIFLVLVNDTGGIKKITKNVQSHGLAASQDKMRSYTFQGIDTSKWTRIYVIAVIYRHHGSPKALRIK